MHVKNIHNKPYNFSKLTAANPALKPYVFTNEYHKESVNFALPEAVFELNKALLMAHYGLVDYQLPVGYLCPPVPSRADYLWHLKDLITPKFNMVKGLDIGVGANAIYSILGAQLFGWQMLGVDTNEKSVQLAEHNCLLTPNVSKLVTIRLQNYPGFIFKNIIEPDNYLDFTMCNPPFHSSPEAALKGTNRKLKNLNLQAAPRLNFGGQAHELWCNGGEALFIKRMIKESVQFSNQVGWFTTLVSKAAHLPKLIKQLEKLKAEHRIINMEQGQKITRILAWRFTT
ncbi:23S rRNA (adenine(1618)-N(6))-methyltransferase RlmF [Bizionia sediminis]|uniref:23S rRNA (Adenine(1618)-N(6))-methyltransferase RlmF n=1 Tax=Bizionia sediminis TaxID=1737064 RepID=A0ABW5KR56_9FLAO